MERIISVFVDDRRRQEIQHTIELIRYTRGLAVKQINIIELMTNYVIGRWIVEEQQNGADRAQYRARVSVKPENPEKYMKQLSKAVALVAAGIAAGALVGLWNVIAGVIVMILGVAVCLWIGAKIMKDVK